jgi:hypothetical protein
MPLNKLENFIKNTEGRILYVNPNDLDATDGVENQGNSLTKPFKTIQRALIESARFSYLKGSDNDITEKTTILLFPGEHIIDNRPGHKIKTENGIAKAVKPDGNDDEFAQSVFTLTLNTNFDLTQEDNILHKFNSFNGGVIVPRGTSIVGLDLRKTKIRPKYVPNPTDDNIPSSAIFRVTGACYFWQFTFFDGDERTGVYTDPVQFGITASPTFSHHKLTCFEYADGVNKPTGFELTDLDMYYAKLSNAFNRASGREITQSEKYPNSLSSFAKQRSEWEIVGAFETDPINISAMISGDGATPGNIITVTTSIPHGLTADTPIKIRGVDPVDFNISTKVLEVLTPTKFTYNLPFVRTNLPAGPQGGLNVSSATVTVETDTVSGASPYIFNISMRSVWGMQGMHADGSKSDGFRSMVVAQFTAVSLQKDDRAFVKYNPTNRSYSGIDYETVTGTRLSQESSSTNIETVYHLDPDAIYRRGWETTHVKMSNDAVIQVVSVFAIGFNKHFESLSGGDASITNSNSNFGQLSLAASGYKKEAFGKDNKGYISHIITPRAVVGEETNIEWVQFDTAATNTYAKPGHIYLYTYTDQDIVPPIISQGYRIGAKVGEELKITTAAGNTYSAKVYMNDYLITESNTSSSGTSSSEKRFISSTPTLANSIVQFTQNHNFINGETIRIISGTGDLPENIDPHKVYYAITASKNSSRTDGISLGLNQIQLASSRTNSSASTPIYINAYGGEQLEVISRVSDKDAGSPGHPIQWDYEHNHWYIHVESNNQIYQYIQNNIGTLDPFTDISYVLRKEDTRSLDERLYKLRYIVPKELVNGRGPTEGFIIQESSSTSVRSDADFSLTVLDETEASFYDYNRNPKFISDITFNLVTRKATVRCDTKHDLKVGDTIIVRNVTSETNTGGTENLGYNGTFLVTDIDDDKVFKYSEVDIFGTTHSVGTFSNNVHNRTTSLPRFERNDLQKNFYSYRSETITPYIEGVQDGIYHLYVLNSSIPIDTEFTNYQYSQNVTDLYPQLDRDNLDDNPPAAKSFAKRRPLGQVVSNDLKKSLTKENLDTFMLSFGEGLEITNAPFTNTFATLTFDRPHNLDGITKYNTLNAGTGHNEGTYYNVKLYNSPQFSNIWHGATATVTVNSSGQVSAASITEGGSAYTDGEVLWFDADVIGGTQQANIEISTNDITVSNGNYVQLTGISTAGGGYYRINSVATTNQISIARTTGDPKPNVGEYAVVVGREVSITQESYDSQTGISTFKSTTPHGLLAGNSFRILDSNNNNLGDYIVSTASTTGEFTSKTKSNLSTASVALKHFIGSNAALSDEEGENLGVRGISFFANEVLNLTDAITSEVQFKVSLPAGTGIIERFGLGSYIQIDNEIMRITSTTLQGVGLDEITVVRGALGTIIEDHVANSLIRKINPIAIELRRPSILRASGHTFEYLGYGPGNYSTGLPQVQLKTLTEIEDFLSQSQETSAGQVIYTGMNSDGDFYIGNTKYSAQSGEQTVFDVPVPTITGEDPNRLSVVFDEVIVKERILVEGGNSGQILSQFDGPVTFNETVRINSVLILGDDLRVNGKVEFRNETNSTDWNNGSVIFRGGVGIAKDVNIKGTVDIDTNLNVDGLVTFTNTQNNTLGNVNTGSVQIDGGLGVAGQTTFGSNITINSDSTVDLNGTLDVDGISYFDNVRIDGNKIDTTTGNLTIDSAGGTTTIDDTLSVSGSSTFSSFVDMNDRLEVDNVRINGNEIDTTTGNLTIDSAGGTTTINDTLSVSGSSSFNSNVAISGALTVTGDITAFYSASDSNLKENIVPIKDALDKVNSISGNTFTWKKGARTLLPHGDDTGVIAQEIEALGLPGMVQERDGHMSVQYHKIIPILIEAIKELSEKVSVLEDRLNQ